MRDFFDGRDKNDDQKIFLKLGDIKYPKDVDVSKSGLHISAALNSKDLIYSTMTDTTKAKIQAQGINLNTPIYQNLNLDVASLKHIVNMTAEHLEEFPEQPRDGFENGQKYLEFNQKRNSLWAKEKDIFNKSIVDLSFDDPELPGKKQTKILVECADGRNSPTLFISKEDLIKRYSIGWLPFAGLIIVPEIDNTLTESEMDAKFKAEPDLENMVFERFDVLYGQKVAEFFQKKAHMPQFEKLDFEFQSHFDGHHFPHHGCGAWCSDFNKAQLETIKDCQLTERWLKARYPEQFAKGDFRVYRTAHDTGNGGNIYEGALMDRNKVDVEFYEQNVEKFNEAGKYLAPKKPGNNSGIVTPYVANHIEINEADHDEQTVRISQNHFAHTLVGQSVLEICWIENANNVFAHLKVLLGIIEKNYRKNHPDKPAIVHLDVPENNQVLEKVYFQVMELIQNDAELKSKEEKNELNIVTTRTDSHTYVSRIDNN